MARHIPRASECTFCGAELPRGHRNKCSKDCRHREADQNRRRREGQVPRVEAGELRRFCVALTGGVITLGDESYSLDVSGRIYVMAANVKAAREAAHKALAQMHDRGTTLPDGGLDLDVGPARPVGAGDVYDFEDEPAAREAEAS